MILPSDSERKLIASYPIRFEAAGRTIASFQRRLFIWGANLDDLLSGAEAPVTVAPAGCEGVLLRSLAEAQLPMVLAASDGAIAYTRDRYPRYYARLDGSFDAYLKRLSSKTRSTLKRKVNRFMDLSGGALDMREYRSPSELLDFHASARSLSAKTYQERLMGAGLPDNDAFLADMARRGREGCVRGYLLLLDDKPVSYLYTPIDEGRVIYAYLGYDPAHAAHSPGTVLQYEVMRRLLEEGQFRLFDFTEGDGQHKRQFGTDSVACVDLLLLRPTMQNRLLVLAHGGFNKFIEATGETLDRYDAKARLKRLLRNG